MVSDEIDSLLESYVEKRVNGLLGVAVMAVDNQGKIVYSGAAGKRSLDPGNVEPMSLDTVVWIASQTKLMTAVASMQCVERGQIGLDDDVGLVCPDLANPQILEGFQDDGTPKLRRAERKLTLRNLLSHTNGMIYGEHSPDIMRWRKHVGITHDTFSGNIEGSQVPLLSEPGSFWGYGVGMDWAGQIIERLNGCTLEDYMRENIWKPLGMKSTTFHPEKWPDFESRRAGWAVRQHDGTLAQGTHIWHLPAEHDIGGAGLFSTCEDYVKLLAALLQNGGGVLTKESVDEIGKPLLKDNALISSLWNSRSHLHPAGTELNFGLTVEIDQNGVPGGCAPGTFRWDGLPNTIWWVDRATGVAGTVLQQIEPSHEPVSEQFHREFQLALYKHLRA